MGSADPSVIHVPTKTTSPVENVGGIHSNFGNGRKDTHIPLPPKDRQHNNQTKKNTIMSGKDTTITTTKRKTRGRRKSSNERKKKIPLRKRIKKKPPKRKRTIKKKPPKRKRTNSATTTTIRGLPGIGVQINSRSRVGGGGGAGAGIDTEVQRLIREIKADARRNAAGRKPTPPFRQMYANWRTGEVKVDGETMTIQEAIDRGYLSRDGSACAVGGQQVVNIF